MTPVMRTLKRSRRARLVAAASAAVIVWSLAAAAQAQTLPTGGVVVTSTDGVGVGASFTPGANSLTIDQSADRVVIDWATFNIGSTETVTFNQPTENAIAFNRVDPSAFTTIDGALVSNGGVWLFSPGGLLFGAGATVNVGSFVGSTATLANADIADALTTNAVTLTPGAALGTLTVTNGADINAATGFAVLLGETIVQNGQVVSNLDAVWYGVAQGGEIAFTPGVSAGEGPDLTDATVAGVAGQQPSLTQGSTGVTTAGTWVGVSTPSTTANGWATLINLGGTIEASGIKPSTDAGVYIITGDDGVYDLTAVDTTVDSTGGLITANNGDVFIRTGVATLQDVYAEDIDVFTGGDLTLTGAIQASNDIVIGSDTLISIESAADVHANIDVIVTTTAAGGDIDVDGEVYGYTSVTMVAHDQLTVDGTIEGVYGVSLTAADVTTAAGSLITSNQDVYIFADNTVNLSGDIYAYSADIVADGDVNQNAGTITVDDGGLYIYALNDITTGAGALIETSPDGGMGIIYLNAGHDLYLAGDIHGGYFVTINSVGIGNDTILEVSGSIYSTDFIILYNDYGDIHLTGTAELYAGSPIVFGEPGIWIAAEGSILTDAGSYIHTRPGYADGYVHFEVNDVTGSIDLSSDITSENITIEAPFGVVDIYLRGGTIQTANNLDIDSNGVLLVGANIYADYVTLQADGDLTFTGVINAVNSASLISTGGDVYISGFIEAYAASGTAILVSAEEDLTMVFGGDFEAYGDVVLQTTGANGVLEVSGDVLGDNVYLSAQGGILVGSTADIYAYYTLQLLSDGPGGTVADIQIDGIMDGNGVSIVNRNDGDVVFGSTAQVQSYYYYCGSCRTDPEGQTALLGMDGDIYIYSAGSVITAAGSVIDATQGFGADAGLITIVSTGADGFSATPAAIDLSGDIIADNVVLTATAGSIRQRTGTISFTEGFTADAELNFIQDGGGVIDGLDGVDYASVDIDANNNILLLGVIEGYYVDLTTTGSVPGSDIQLAGEVYASDGITITNLNGDILVLSTGVIHTGSPFETGSPDIDITANGTITTEAGSQIYTDAQYGPGSQITLLSNAVSGTGIDLAGDIWTAGEVYIRTSGDSDVQISGGYTYAGIEIQINSSGGMTTLAGSDLVAGDFVRIRSDRDMILSGDIYAGAYVVASIYGGESGGVDESLLRVEGDIGAGQTIRLVNTTGDVEIGAGAQINGNLIGAYSQSYQYAFIEITGETILTEVGSLITVGAPAGPRRGDIFLHAYDVYGGPTLVDLSGDIDTESLYLYIENGSMHVRDGDIQAINDLGIYVEGYFTVDDPASIETDGSFYASAVGGVTFDGYLQADLAVTLRSTGADVSVGGQINGYETILVDAAGDIALGPDAILWSDYDLGGAAAGVTLDAAGLVVTAAGSVINVGQAGNVTGDVNISADGLDTGGFSSIDLAGDISAQHLYIDTLNGSVRLRDGDIVLTGNLSIDSPRGFLMDGLASITTDGYVDISAVYQATVAGTITSGDFISIASTGSPGGGVTVNGYLYADAGVTISSNDPNASIVLGGPTIISDADNTGADGGVTITSAGSVLAPGGGLIRVGDGTGAPTGDVAISADGGDASTTSAIDIAIDIEAQTLTLDAPNGSIHLAGGDIYVTEDLGIDSVLDFLMDAPATITGLGDVDITAANNLVADGQITAGGDVSLHVENGLGVGYFTAGPGDLVVSGDVTANGSVSITSGEGGGDIYLDPTANVLANADDAGTGDDVYISAYQQVITAAGSSIAVGTTPATSGEVTILAGGTDNANYSAIDLSGDIDAQTLVLQTANGSIHLADGTINVLNDLTINSNFDIVMAYGAEIFGDGNVDFIADRDLVVDGLIDAQGGVSLMVAGGGQDLEVGGVILADQDVDIVNLGGDVLIDGAQIVADADSFGADGDILIQANGQVVADGGSLVVGAAGAPTGDVLIEAFGADNANYSAIDLASDIEAVNLTIDADAGSVNLAGGTIDITGDLYVEADYDIVQDEPANIYAGGDVYFGANRSLTVEGSIHADGDVELLINASPNAGLLSVDRLVAAGGAVTIVNEGGDVVLGSQTALFSGADILLSAYGDLTTEGFIDSAATFTADAGGAMLFQSGLQAGDGASFTSGGAMTLDAVIIAEQYSGVIADAGASLDQSGQIIAGGDVRLASAGTMTVTGDITTLGDIGLYVDGGEAGGHLIIDGDLAAHGSILADNNSDGWVLRLNSDASLIADIDGSGGDGVYLYSDGKVITEAGSIVHVGSQAERTGYIVVGSYGYDGEGGAAIQLAGDMDAERIEVWADYGSVHVQDGSIGADESIEIYAYEDFILNDGALIWGAQDRQFPDDVSTETTLPGVLPGVLIAASDVDISGDIQSGDADDDATIVIAALNVDGEVTVGGADNGLGTGFTLSDAEFQSLEADRIVVLAGAGGEGYDLHLADLTIDAANTSDVWFGSSGTIFVEGDIAPNQPGAVDLHLGLTVLTQSSLIQLDPGQTLVDFIPTDIHISGSLGDVSNPFGQVTLVAHGDILMGSAAFIAAAENDPEFDAFDESENYESPGEGHVFVAADILQMAATGAILQQDTVQGPDFGGLVLGAPQQGLELIFSPDDIEGEPIGFGTDQWTANFNAGPTRIELFGQFNGTPHAVTGTAAAGVDHLLDPDILLGDYEFNTCLFGGTECRTGNDLPPFQNPTPPVHPDPTVIPGVDEVLTFFTTFPFQEPDEEEEEERIEGEPVTGSGNEDLWPVTSQGGTRP